MFSIIYATKTPFHLPNLVSKSSDVRNILEFDESLYSAEERRYFFDILDTSKEFKMFYISHTLERNNHILAVKARLMSKAPIPI